MKQKTWVLSFLAVILLVSLVGVAQSEGSVVDSVKPLNLAEPQSAVSKDDHGIAAEPVVITFDKSDANKAWVINMRVEFVNSTNDNLSEFTNGTHLNYTHHIQYCTFEIIDTSLANTVVGSGEFTSHNVSSTDSFWNASISAIHIKESSTLAVRTNFTTVNSLAWSYEVTETFEIKHTIVIGFSLSYSATSDTATVLVSKAESTYNSDLTNDKNAKLTDDNATVHSYSLRERGSGTEAKKGDLEYDRYWDAEIDMGGLRGDYYVVLTFKTDDFLEKVSSPNEPTEDTNLITREGQWDDYIIYIILIAVFAVVLLVGIVMFTKKQEKKIAREPKKKKDGDVKIVEISSSELKKTRLTGPPKKKKKVKKMKEDAFVFNVPTWEVDDEDEAAATSTASATPSFNPTASAASVPAAAPVVAEGFTLHCPSCNSWYEIDFFEKMDCPKCDSSLEVAMWCQQCSKWFDVPEPGAVNCPICSLALKTSK